METGEFGQEIGIQDVNGAAVREGDILSVELGVVYRVVLAVVVSERGEIPSPYLAEYYVDTRGGYHPLRLILPTPCYPVVGSIYRDKVKWPILNHPGENTLAEFVQEKQVEEETAE